MMTQSRWASPLIGLLLSLPCSASEIRVTLRGSGTEMKQTPICLGIDGASIEPGAYTLRDPDGDRAPISSQVTREGDSTTISAVIPSLGAEEEVVYLLEPASDVDSGVTISPEGKNLRVAIDGSIFTIYRADDGPKPYFFPVIGPTGVPITRAYPMEEVEGEDRDHPHQRSFWFTHGDVDGVDFWASDPLNRANPKFGAIVETGRLTVADGPVMGVIQTSNEWQSPDGEVLCTDHRSWRTYATEGIRVIDFDVTIIGGDRPVTFRDTKEGSFGLRLASSMNVNKKAGGRIVNAEGLTDLEAWGKASSWVDYTGPIGDETLGVAILNHPGSFRYPTTWHVRDYGLFAANPFGYRDFKYEGAASGDSTIEPGDSIRLSYRVILHEGDTEKSEIAGAFEAYANPPVIELSVDAD